MEDIRELISRPVVRELALFENAFCHLLDSDNSKMQQVKEHILQTNGKKLRPILLLLSALLSGKVSDVTIKSAVFIELFHTASLLHDDVVDDAKLRRGKPSVNAVFDNKVAVLSGDYLFTASAQAAASMGNLQIIAVLGKLGMHLSLGELDQLTNVDELDFSEASYLKVIREKTAMLFAACTEIGALSADASEAEVAALRSYGEHIGMAFQIRDDIFDYFDDANIGKPTGNDIREGKVTLPLIYAIEHAGEKERKSLTDLLRTGDFSDENVHKLITFAKENQGINYAYQTMQVYADKAKAALHIFPDVDAKAALLAFVDYVIVRDK
ncbi:MAG: polyprenyl synthetase family protein [Dysgonamonadaceae bacterium]|jgi:octaprenyl-diphosphate synthase|nr:polyprenyl synthetase family protein [Dysgonamonadaceae bacterium]